MILQRRLPADMRPLRALPGVQPLRGPWLWVDEAYAAQMARRTALLAQCPEAVLYLEERARPAAKELLALALSEAAWPRAGDVVTRPDGAGVLLNWGDPMRTLGRLFQCDFVLMDRAADAAEHVLVGAVLCFPASWSLTEKAGRPLSDIHVPVPEYDSNIARRVQRLFDGVQVGRPVWRCNGLWYHDAELFQPRSRKTPAGRPGPTTPFYRAERQTILRLPQSRAVVFAIHTYVVRSADL